MSGSMRRRLFRNSVVLAVPDVASARPGSVANASPAARLGQRPGHVKGLSATAPHA